MHWHIRVLPEEESRVERAHPLHFSLPSITIAVQPSFHDLAGFYDHHARTGFGTAAGLVSWRRMRRGPRRVAVARRADRIYGVCPEHCAPRPPRIAPAARRPRSAARRGP